MKAGEIRIDLLVAPTLIVEVGTCKNQSLATSFKSPANTWARPPAAADNKKGDG